jgi:hypothetical protein
MKSLCGNAQAFFICNSGIADKYYLHKDELVGIIVLKGHCFRIAQIWHNQRPFPHAAVVSTD